MTDQKPIVVVCTRGDADELSLAVAKLKLAGITVMVGDVREIMERSQDDHPMGIIHLDFETIGFEPTMSDPGGKNSIGSLRRLLDDLSFEHPPERMFSDIPQDDGPSDSMPDVLREMMMPRDMRYVLRNRVHAGVAVKAMICPEHEDRTFDYRTANRAPRSYRGGRR